MNKELNSSLNRLKAYIENSEYKGFDPYDALKSPLFNFSILKSNKLIRFGIQQLVKRSPLNLRTLLFIPKGYNPVTLGLAIQSYSYLYQTDLDNREEYMCKINFLVDELEKLIPIGFSGACWGYDFDWEAYYIKIPAYQPTVVATGIITNALFIAHQITNHKRAKELVISASNFVINDLNRTTHNNNVCFSYSPFDRQQVFNASMKGVRVLAQANFLNKNIKSQQLAKQATAFVMSHQKDDGSWGYSLENKGAWTDNYHTGYVLDCLDEYQKLMKDDDYSEKIKKGYFFYEKHFITNEGIPKFYHNNIYPIDCTSASQTILTTIRFGNVDLAEKVASWMIENMQKKNGSFNFRKFRKYTIITSFMRWSNAWMLTALSNLKLNK